MTTLLCCNIIIFGYCPIYYYVHLFWVLGAQGFLRRRPCYSTNEVESWKKRNTPHSVKTTTTNYKKGRRQVVCELRIRPTKTTTQVGFQWDTSGSCRVLNRLADRTTTTRLTDMCASGQYLAWNFDEPSKAVSQLQYKYKFIRHWLCSCQSMPHPVYSRPII